MRRWFSRFAVTLFVTLMLFGLDVPGPRSPFGFAWPMGLTGSAHAKQSFSRNASNVGANLGLDCEWGPCRVATGPPREWVNTYVGDHINFATGNLFNAEIDYTTAGSFPFVLARYYNSLDEGGRDFGPNWRASYSRSITFFDNWGTAVVTRDDGRTLIFNRVVTDYFVSPWEGPTYSSYRLSGGFGNNLTLVTDQDEVETYRQEGFSNLWRLISYTNRAGLTLTFGYDRENRLSTVTDPFGRTLTFSYGLSPGLVSRISQAQTPDGKVYDYGYDGLNRLASVTYPDGSKRTYLYEDYWHDTGLTGVIDENGSRYASFAYDYYTDGASSSERGGGADRYTVDYGLLGWNVARVWTPLGAPKRFTITSDDGLKNRLGEWRACSDCSPNFDNGQSDANTYDGHANLKSHTDFNGNRTTYDYDDEARHLPTSQTLAAGTPLARTITTRWHRIFASRPRLSRTSPARTTIAPRPSPTTPRAI